MHQEESPCAVVFLLGEQTRSENGKLEEKNKEEDNVYALWDCGSQYRTFC
jgi:hypothetical protein